MKKSFVLIVVTCSVLILFLIPSSTIAVSVSMSSVPSSVEDNQEIEIDIYLSCSGCRSDSYLRGVFYPSMTSYFGFTQNNEGNWVNAPGGSCTQYLKISTDELVEGTWSGKLKVKPDNASPLYSGPGEYLFKVGRYTSSCGSPTWSQESTIAIIGPTTPPTIIPTLSPSLMPTDKPDPTNTPTPTKTLTPTKTKTPTPTKKITTTPRSDDQVLGTSQKSGMGKIELEGPDFGKEEEEDDSAGVKKGISPVLFLVFGGIAMGGMVYSAYSVQNKKM